MNPGWLTSFIRGQQQMEDWDIEDRTLAGTA